MENSTLERKSNPMGRTGHLIRNTASMGVVLVFLLLAFALLNHFFWKWFQPDAGQLEALATAFSAAAILLGFYLNYLGIQHASRLENLDLISRMFDKFNSPEQVEARTWVFQKLDGSKSRLNDKEKGHIKAVLKTLDEIALYFEISGTQDEAVMRYINPMVVKSWARLAPYVLEQREMRQEADYYIDAERLALRCIAWRIERYGSAKIEWIDPRQAL
jgi:hypothetical protein